MDIKIEVVGKEEELEFPYVVETGWGTKILVLSKNLGIVIKRGQDSPWSNYKLLSADQMGECNKRYKILEANYKLKEV